MKRPLVVCLCDENGSVLSVPLGLALVRLVACRSKECDSGVPGLRRAVGLYYWGRRQFGRESWRRRITLGALGLSSSTRGWRRRQRFKEFGRPPCPYRPAGYFLVYYYANLFIVNLSSKVWSPACSWNAFSRAELDVAFDWNC